MTSSIPTPSASSTNGAAWSRCGRLAIAVAAALFAAFFVRPASAQQATGGSRGGIFSSNPTPPFAVRQVAYDEAGDPISEEGIPRSASARRLSRSRRSTAARNIRLANAGYAPAMEEIGSGEVVLDGDRMSSDRMSGDQIIGEDAGEFVQSGPYTPMRRVVPGRGSFYADGVYADGSYSDGELMEGGEGFEVDGPECWDDDYRWHPLDNLWAFAGTQGFKGPVDQGTGGNFGYAAGLNYGLALSYQRPIAVQVGARFVQSDFSGSPLDSGDRSQLFFTAGVFHRVDHGWQYGAAFDWLRDQYYTEIDVHQVRAEISWVSVCGNELGVLAAISTADDNAATAAGATPTQFFEVNDQFALFLRVPFANGGEGRILAGGTSDQDGIVGGEFTVPITNKWSLQTAATYLIPNESSDSTGINSGHANEQWGMGINLVWYPGQCPVVGYNPIRPLFNVADNTSMLVDRRLP